METENIQVRIAGGDEDLSKFNSWLPQAFLSLPRPLFFLAENKGDSEIVAIGSLRILGEKEKTGRFQLYVLPKHRRKGTGTCLMRTMVDYSRNEGARAMLAGVPVPDKSEEELFFKSLVAFKIKRTLYHFAMKIDVAWDYLDPLVKRLTKKGGLPEGYEIVPLEKADRKRVYSFVLKHLGGIPDSLIQRLRGGKKGSYLPKLSLVVRSVEGPAAVLLVRKSKRGLVVDSRVVAPKYRGTWVNVALMYYFVSAVRPMGVKEVYFEGDDQLHEDTMKLARRGACETIETNRLYGCDLESNTKEA